LAQWTYCIFDDPCDDGVWKVQILWAFCHCICRWFGSAVLQNEDSWNRMWEILGQITTRSTSYWRPLVGEED
jgi:hypothetical protein